MQVLTKQYVPFWIVRLTYNISRHLTDEKHFISIDGRGEANYNLYFWIVESNFKHVLQSDTLLDNYYNFIFFSLK